MEIIVQPKPNSGLSSKNSNYYLNTSVEEGGDPLAFFLDEGTLVYSLREQSTIHDASTQLVLSNVAVYGSLNSPNRYDERLLGDL